MKILFNMEQLKKKYIYACRGLREVKTDEKGKDLIKEMLSTTNDLISTMESYMSEIEMNNEQLVLMLTDVGQLRREHALLKMALNVTTIVDDNLKKMGVI